MSSTDVAHKLHSKPRTDDVVINENVDFTGLMLGDAVLRGLEKSGFKRPSPIQLKAIPLGRCGLDLIVQAKSGTGKTCVFSVCCLDSIVVDGNSLQVLVLAPTREIAVQIWEVMNGIGAAFDGLCCYCFIGGMPVSEDQLKLRKCHIAVGTPGRIKQLIQEGCMVTDNIRMFVLDEADKLLEDNFQESVNWIYSTLPENKQMLALSATYPESLAQHLTSYMRNPTFIRLNSDDPTLLGIRHYYKKVGFHPLAQKAFDYKVKELINILSTVSFNQCLVFSNFQMRAQSLSDILNASGWPSTYISGSQDQQHRFTAMAKLKKYKCRVLISTDLTSRGIDAENVNLVVNLDIPKDHETYLHRIGRAGRFGTYGAGISLAAEGEELDRLYNIQQKCNKSIKVLPDPIPSDLAHSSGYVNIENLVITEQIITDTDTKSPKADKHPDEIVVSSTNHTDVNSKTSSNISDQNSAEGNIMNNDNKTKTDIESKEKQMSEEYSQVDGNKTEILKRKILKSGRKKIDEKKNPWSEWLATSEDSINKENANRESTRGAVAYDVDMFGNGTEKVKHNQVSKSESNAASKSNIFVDDKDSVGKSTQSNTTALKLANTAESPSKFDCTERELVTYDDFDIFGSSSKKDKKKKKKKNKDVENKEVESAAVNENELAGSGDTAVTETNSESMDLLKGGSDDHIVAKPKQLWSKKYKDEKDPNKMSYEELLSSYVHHKKNVSKDDQLNQNVKKQLDVEDVLTDITQKLQNTLISEECSENKNAYTFEESKEDFENFMKLDPSEQEQELQKALDGRCVGKKGSFEDETFENIEKLLSIQKSQQEQLFHTGKILKEVNGVQKQESNATDVNVKEDKDNFVGENSQEQAKPQKPLFMGMTGSRVPAPDTNRQPVFLKTAVESSTYYSKHNNDVKSEICDIDEQLQNLSLRPPEDQSLGQEYMKLLGAKPEKEDGEISQEEGEINGSFSEDEVTKTKVSEPENVYRGRAFNNWVPVESPRHEYGEELLDYAYHNDSTYDIEHEDSRKEDHYYHPENNEPAYYKSRKDNRKKDKQCGYEGKYDHDNIDYEYDPDNKEYEQYQEYEYNQDKGYYHHSNNDLSKTAKHYYEAQQYMCAAQMNHMYWMNLSQSAQSFSSQYWQQMATWHSQCSRYYKDLYKKEQLKEELYKEYQSKKEYISGMSSSKSN